MSPKTEKRGLTATSPITPAQTGPVFSPTRSEVGFPSGRERAQTLWIIFTAAIAQAPCRERVLYCQPTGPNPLNHRDDFSRPALRHGSLNQGADRCVARVFVRILVEAQRHEEVGEGFHLPPVVFKAHRHVYHSTLGSRVMKKKKRSESIRVRVQSRGVESK